MLFLIAYGCLARVARTSCLDSVRSKHTATLAWSRNRVRTESVEGQETTATTPFLRATPRRDLDIALTSASVPVGLTSDSLKQADGFRSATRPACVSLAALG